MFFSDLGKRFIEIVDQWRVPNVTIRLFHKEIELTFDERIEITNDGGRGVCLRGCTRALPMGRGGMRGASVALGLISSCVKFAVIFCRVRDG